VTDVSSVLALAAVILRSPGGDLLAFVHSLPQIVGLALLSTAVAGAGAVVFRWYAHDTVPEGVAVLLGLSAVALVLNTTTILADAIGAGGESVVSVASPADDRFLQTTAVTVASFALAIVGADLGRRLGDRTGNALSVRVPLRGGLDRDVGQLLKARGRVLRVTLPDEIADIDGYDPVSDDLKESLAGSTLSFPRRLTRNALRTRLIDRLTSDYRLSAVDVEIDAEGTVTYLGVGSRVAGLGTTIAPGQVAVAIRADPPASASPGDVVQVWEGGTDPTQVTDAEFRASAGDIVTLVVDEGAASALDPADRYRLVTLPAESVLDREFAALLRSADETMAAITVEADSILAGLPVSALDVTVLAIRGEATDALPAPDRVLAPGDVVYAIGRTGALRLADAAARDVGPQAGAVPAPASPPEDE
jgi:hypothetical protein